MADCSVLILDITAAVIAFPAHFYVLAPVDPEWVRAQLPAGDYSAPIDAGPACP